MKLQAGSMRGKAATVFTFSFLAMCLLVVVGCGSHKLSPAQEPRTWTDIGGGNNIMCLACDSTHNLLYAGTAERGVWKYDGTSWNNTGGEFSRYMGFHSLVYDSGRNILYAGATGGVWKYDGTKWTNTDGDVSGYSVRSLAFDSKHSVLYAGTDGHGVWKYNSSR